MGETVSRRGIIREQWMHAGWIDEVIEGVVALIWGD